MACIKNPQAANQIFLVSDDEDISTTELLKRIGRIINKPARLLSVPPFYLQRLATALGKKDMYARLCDSLQVDISKTKEMLDWKPPISVNEGLKTILSSEGF